MSVPAGKKSKTRTRKGRSHHGLTLPHLVACPNCKAMVLPHRACPKCGYYKGREIKNA